MTLNNFLNECRMYIIKGVDNMAFIEGEDRYQINLLPNTLDDFVSDDNPVRVIDAYVDSLDLEGIGFKVYCGNKAGQKPYKRKDLLKIYKEATDRFTESQYPSESWDFRSVLALVKDHPSKM